MIIQNISENLINLRIKSGLNQSELAKELGISRQTLSNYEKGTREPDIFTLIRISQYFNCSIDFLVFDNHDINLNKLYSSQELMKFNNINISIVNFLKTKKSELNELFISLPKRIDEVNQLINLIENKTNVELNKVNRDAVEFSNDITPNLDKNILIPIVGTIAAGLPILAQSNIEDYLNIPLKKPLFDCRKDKYYALKVKGNSMNKLFKNNEILIIEQTNIVDNNDIAVVLIDNEATVKKVKFDNDLIHLIPESTDPSYTVQEYDTKKDKISIQGKLITTLKEYMNNKN